MKEGAECGNGSGKAIIAFFIIAAAALCWKWFIFVSMARLTIQPADSNQETAIRLFLDALHVEYKADDATDETQYLSSSQAMRERLDKAIDEEKNGEGVNISLDDIWK